VTATKRRQNRVAKARAIRTHTREEWNALIAEVKGRCVICARFCNSLSKDHITPVYAGGHDGIENLQPVCRSCNSAKGASDSNWLEYRRLNGWPESGQLELALPKLKRDKLMCRMDWHKRHAHSVPIVTKIFLDGENKFAFSF
jgi:hypothetical protein